VGNRIKTCDGNDHCSQNFYDAVNRLIAVTDALNETSHYEYDPAGNLLETLDREAHAMCYVYDDINRRIRSIQKVGDTDCNVIDGDDVWTKTVYDRVGNVIELTTAKKNDGGTPPTCNSLSSPEDCESTRYRYDEVNRLVQEAYPLRQAGDTVKNTREFSYDKASNLKKRFDQKNHTTDYVYNDLYYLTLRDYQVDPDDRFAYDTGGRMLRAGRAGWVVTFDYDDANRVLHTTQDGKSVDYLYDIPNRRRAMAYPGGKVVTEDRDFRERLAEINGGSIAAYQYDFGNRVLTRSYGNGTAANYAYNDNNWITSLTHTKAGPTLIAGFGHNYDQEGNKRSEDKTHDPGKSEGYEYDDLYRLIDYKVGTLVGSTVPVPITQTQYCLDKLGNWDCKVHMQGGITTTENRQYNAVNEITQIDAVPLSYDNNGNLIHDNRYSYEYDQENRLTKVSFTDAGSSKIAGEYRYDALSRRIVKKTGLSRGNKETHYFYDDARIIEEKSSAGAIEANYVYGNYIDEVLTMDRDTGGTPAFETYYYHQNTLWSVEAITDSAANVVERYAYDAYGHQTIKDGLGNVLTNSWGTAHSAIGNPWMFTGRQYDEETGLYYYRARYYDSGKGRFLTRGPGKEISTSDKFYEYTSSNPTRFIDPRGNATAEVQVAIAALGWDIAKEGDKTSKIPYEFDRMRGFKYPNDDSSWATKGNWKDYATSEIILFCKSRSWLPNIGPISDIKVKFGFKVHWEANGYGLHEVYLTKVSEYENIYWDGEVTVLIVPKAAVRIDNYHTPVAQADISSTWTCTSSCKIFEFDRVTFNAVHLIDGEGKWQQKSGDLDYVHYQ
jgi:RHS repeat-associated protein